MLGQCVCLPLLLLPSRPGLPPPPPAVRAEQVLQLFVRQAQGMQAAESAAVEKVLCVEEERQVCLPIYGRQVGVC